jgi:hypothetical protein
MKQKLTAVITGLSMMALAHHAGAAPDLSKLPPPSDRTGLTFTNDILPVFKDSCANCHNGPRARAGLHLDTLEGVLNGGMNHGQKSVVVTPGNSETSPLVIAVARLDPHSAMPPVRRGRPPGAPGGPQGGTNPPPPNMLPPPPPGNPPPDGAPPPPGAAGAPVRQFGPPPKPLTPEQVGLVRAWIDQGAK